MTRRIVVTVLVFMACASTAWAEPSALPHPIQTATDTKALEFKLKQRATEWLNARKKLIVRCTICGEDGNLNGRVCKECDGQGRKYSETGTKKVLFDFRSPEWQGRPTSASEVDRGHKELNAGLQPGFFLRAFTTPRVHLVDATHGTSTTTESSSLGKIEKNQRWILRGQSSGNPVWYLWTDEETDGAWPDPAAVAAPAERAPPEDTAPAKSTPSPTPPTPEASAPETAPAPRGATSLTTPLTLAEIGYDPSDSAGLFVGIRSFTDASDKPSRSISEIAYGVDDAIDLAYTFSLELGLIPAGRVFLGLSGDPQKEESAQRLAALLAAGAQRDPAKFVSLRTSVKSVCNLAGPKGLLVMSFATHGQHIRDGDDILLTRDSLLNDPETALRVSWLTEELSNSAAPRRVLLLDACRERFEMGRSVSSAEAALSPSFVERLGQHEGTFVLFAAPLGGYSYDDPELRNGVFTGAIIRALHGAAATDEDGFITLGAVAESVNKRIKEWCATNRAASGKPADIERRGGLDLDDMPLARRRDPEVPDEVR